MGTRNLTLVKDREGKTKVAQYGQWDGYPEGQGSTILNFIKSKENRDALAEVLKNVRFFNLEAAPQSIKDYIEGYDKRTPQWSNEPDNRTEADKYWFDNLISRDVCGKILERLVAINIELLPDEFEKVIYLQDKRSFADDSLFCEWAYCVNYQTEKLEVYVNGKEKVIDFDFEHLPDEDDFCKQIHEILKDCSDDEED